MSKIEGKRIVFTGFRDAELEKWIEDNDGKVNSSVSGNTDIVIYADTDIAKNSSKYKKAEELGIELLTVDKFKKKYM